VTERIDEARVLEELATANPLGTREELDRLWRAKLVLRAQVRLGRGRGTVCRYGPDASAQVLRIRALLSEGHSYATVGWTLWTEGFQVGDQYWREPLEACAHDWDKLRPWIGTLLGSERRLARAAHALFTRRAASPLCRVRKAVQWQRFRPFLRQVLEVAVGGSTGFSAITGEDEPDRIRAAKRWDAAMGLFRARSDRLNWLPPLVSGPYDERVLRALSNDIERGPLVRQLDAISLGDLRIASHQVAGLLELFANLSGVLERIGGPRAFGLRRVAEFAASRDLKFRVSVTLLWALHSQRRRLREHATALLRYQNSVAELATKIRENPKLRADPKVGFSRAAAPWPHEHPQLDSADA
jgi:hypothetical protein